MTPKRHPTKQTGGNSWRGRREAARAFLRAARRLRTLHEDGEDANPILVLVIHAAIAYGDALTDKFGAETNKQDHQMLSRLVSQKMGNRADKKQIDRLGKILAEKDNASYGARVGRIEHVDRLIEQLERFTGWAEGELS